jgi:DNA modification methylase
MITTERFEKVAIDKLIPYARNARTHSKEQVLQLRASLREFGFVNPVIVDKELNIIAGHGRILAAKEEGISEVPCVFVEHLTEAQKRAYILADNRLAMNAGWDNDMLSVELSDLQGADFDLALLGFDDKELEKLLADGDDNAVEDDDFNLDAALEDAAFVLPGDLWLVGQHRLICGDCTDPAVISRLMQDKKANLLLTDPPYGVSYNGNAGKIKNDDIRGDELVEKLLLPSFKNAFDAMDDEASAYIFHADTQGEWFRRAFREAGFKLSGVCQWVKPSLVLGRSPYQWQHEPVLFGWKTKHKWFAGRDQTTVWEFGKPKKNDIHPTMKPLDLLSKPIQNSTAANAIVLDLFSGSFSTGIACSQLDRVCYAVELDPKYASASLRRTAEHIGAENISCERDGKVLAYADLVKEVAKDG